MHYIIVNAIIIIAFTICNSIIKKFYKSAGAVFSRCGKSSTAGNSGNSSDNLTIEEVDSFSTSYKNKKTIITKIINQL